MKKVIVMLVVIGLFSSCAITKFGCPENEHMSGYHPYQIKNKKEIMRYQNPSK